MITAYPAAATHRPYLFAALLAAIMPVFNALHDAQWRAPWRRA
jgi:hypothetical protein